MKVYEAVANAFIKEGTTVIFGLLGDSQIPWWSTMSKHPDVKIIDVREEGAALAMAEGWAMASGRIGVCSPTHGPGLARMTTSLITATRSHTPVVVFTSRTPLNNAHASQRLDQERLVSATGAGYIEIVNPSYAETAVREAFYRARLESRPIVLALPRDIEGKECKADGDAYQPSSTMFVHQQQIRPDLARLNEAVKIIAMSKKPVVLLGRGALNLQAQEAADRLARRIGALTATSMMGKGALAGTDYHAGVAGGLSTSTAVKFFEETDCLIAIGAGLNSRTIEEGDLYPKARVIHVDVQPHIVMGNDRGADCYIQGDAAVTLGEIDDMLVRQGISNEGYRTPAVLEALSHADEDPAEFDIEPGTVDPRDVVRMMDDRLPTSIGLVTGIGHASSAFPVMHIRKPRPLYQHVTAFGCIGQTFPNAIGAAVALNAPLLCMDGDGGALQNIQELDTAARLGIKLFYVVLNDEAYGAEFQRLKSKKMDTSLSAIRSPDFGAVGQVFGCRGRLARTLDEVGNGIDEFLSGDGPMVLDVRISRNVVSIPYRRAHFGQHG